MYMKYLTIILITTLALAAHPLVAGDLDSQDQRYGYTLGIRVGQMLKSQVGGDLDIDAFALAVSDVLSGNKVRLSNEEMQVAMRQHLQQEQARLAKVAEANEKKGRAFLEANAQKEGIVTLENGLQYRVIEAGSGNSPTAEQTVEVNYRGRLIDGTEFDSSYSRGKPAQFKLNGVVPGFKEALTRMKPGAKWEVYMPAELAYGKKGAGRSIGPNETLIFEIEYLRSVN
ncbi:MAG: FKBP-type peptidyl-prolyl cis-trans isomerase [gamma proteobacterium symbiont of Ctena orbiculata]